MPGGHGPLQPLRLKVQSRPELTTQAQPGCLAPSTAGTQQAPTLAGSAWAKITRGEAAQGSQPKYSIPNKAGKMLLNAERLAAPRVGGGLELG